MTFLSASDLAKELGVTKGRVSQYVSGGKLEGCYRGAGRDRRFDLVKVSEALGRRLDRGQMLGNGAATKKAIERVKAGGDDAAPRELPTGGQALPPNDPSGYDMARTQIALEDARRKRRENLLAEGVYVLASEVELQVARAIGQEIKEFEGVLREGARRIADDLGVDFLKARQLLVQVFRSHRAVRSSGLSDQASATAMTETETEADT